MFWVFEVVERLEVGQFLFSKFVLVIGQRPVGNHGNNKFIALGHGLVPSTRQQHRNSFWNSREWRSLSDPNRDQVSLSNGFDRISFNRWIPEIFRYSPRISMSKHFQRDAHQCGTPAPRRSPWQPSQMDSFAYDDGPVIDPDEVQVDKSAVAIHLGCESSDGGTKICTYHCHG